MITVKKKIFVAFLLIVVVALSGFGCKESSSQQYEVDLEVWGVFDDSSAYSEIIAEYEKINPFVRSVRYRKFANVEEYRRDLLNALASGNGPDIFMIHNTWLPSFGDKIVPVNPALLTEQDFGTTFVDVAIKDFVAERQIFALPLSVDSLALYYNKDLFNAEGITAPPTTWTGFNEAIQKLTKVDENGNIVQSGAAIGTADNINRSTDILTLLMLQSGVEMTDANRTTATFNRAVDAGGTTRALGEEALNYYTQFARVSLQDKNLYSWSPRQHYSIDAFFEGTVGMMLNYSWHYDTIKRKNSKLNFAVAPVPQFDGATVPVNYANYWGFAVAKNKDITQDPSAKVQITNDMRIHESWQFLRYLTMPSNGQVRLYNFLSGNSRDFSTAIDPAIVYLTKTRKPAARKDLIEQQKTDPFFGPFATGNLIASSWYQVQPEQNETILAEAITSVNRGTATVKAALDLAANRITQLMR